jgi:hypothetical protein
VCAHGDLAHDVVGALVTMTLLTMTLLTRAHLVHDVVGPLVLLAGRGHARSLEEECADLGAHNLSST